ncbi:ATP-dependent DNA helicase Q1-like [Ruditapes philippinarum]|uniref:ATP-dependent DNA helicase Q1-like n=1 Tax=Ruditapes philippinarum TaxID=129788 RepID=UPI00295BBCE9|nr:ATP-dependent DNA helicase Q1-like [Ruditapes philippinarum]
MGFDTPSVVRIIHAQPPRNLSQYLQEIGRAGRRDQSSTATLYYNKRHIAKNLPGIQDDIVEYCSTNNKCLREMLLKTFGFSKSCNIPAEKCCSFCLDEELKKLAESGAFDENVQII